MTGEVSKLNWQTILFWSRYFSNCFRICINVDSSLHWNIWRQKSRSQQLHHIPTPSVMPKSTLPREVVLYLVRDTWWIGSRLVRTRRILSSVCFFSHNSQSSFFFFKDSASSQQFNKMADSPSRNCFLCSTIYDELESRLVEFSGFFNPSKQTSFKFFSQNCQSSFFFFEEVASSNSSLKGRRPPIEVVLYNSSAIHDEVGSRLVKICTNDSSV